MSHTQEPAIKSIIVFAIIMILVNVFLASSDILLFGKGIAIHIDKHGLWRSARFARSNNFADYILFLREQIPEDARVVIPPEKAANWALTNSPHMQFFLAPREVKNCTTLDCGKAFLKQDNTYILIIGLDTFPGEEIRGQSNHIRMHNDTWGVYGPAEGLGNGSRHPYIGSLWGFFEMVVFPLFVILVILVIGFIVSSQIFPDESVWLRVGLGYGLVLGSYSMIAYFVRLIFPEISLKYLFFGFISLMCIFTLIRLQNWNRVERYGIKRLKDNLSIWVVVIVGLGVLYGVLAVGSGFHATDAIVLWGVKGQGIAYKGFDVIPRWGTNTTNYPLQIPMLVATFSQAFGDSLPIAKIVFPLFYFCLGLIMFGSLSKKIQEDRAGLVTLIFMLSPILVRHARIGYANLALTYYFIIGVILFSSFLIVSGNKSRIWYQSMSAVFFVFAVWTRPEGVWLVLVTWVVFFVVYQIYQIPSPSKLSLLSIIFPAIVFWGVWKLTSTPFQVENGIEKVIRGFMVSISTGDFRLQNLGTIVWFLIQQVFNVQSWAIIGIFTTIAAIQRIRGYHSSLKQIYVFIHFGLISLFIVVGMYYVFAFDPQYDIQWWLGSGFNRMALPALTMTWLGLNLFVFSSTKPEKK